MTDTNNSVARFWRLMAIVYGSAWTSTQGGADREGNWAALLEDYTEDDILSAVTESVNHYVTPPSLRLFRSLLTASQRLPLPKTYITQCETATGVGRPARYRAARYRTTKYCTMS